ncbi:pyruvate dehydrogenase complex E1 component subunit beta [Sesbania bispinosa]|nr:pyruvate dehydrogenase complex E1 component subunit beta [Sesbania bispinosa]
MKEGEENQWQPLKGKRVAAACATMTQWRRRLDEGRWEAEASARPATAGEPTAEEAVVTTKTAAHGVHRASDFRLIFDWWSGTGLKRDTHREVLRQWPRLRQGYCLLSHFIVTVLIIFLASVMGL